MMSNCSMNVTSCDVIDEEDEASDAIWILTSTFIIFTMQSGFGLLESGSVSAKNEVNIMVKNAVDVIIGGLAFWMFGYAFSFGTDAHMSSPFSGWGYFLVSANDAQMGHIYSKFFFQASFATTATTIVSGAMAERTKLEAYIIFSFFNTLIFCFPAHWIWAENGWLRELGFVDIAGSGPVHLIGGMTGLVATLLLKPRLGRFESKYAPPMGSPTSALLGMFMLWWGWLGFNCGSTFGISGYKWKLAARSALATLNSSIGGGCMALLLSYVFEKRKFNVSYVINGLLGSLVAITALCALAEPWEGLVIGAIGASLAIGFCRLEERLKIDDPVGCVGIHAINGCWGIISVGLFSKQDDLKSSLPVQYSKDIPGLFYGGGLYLLGIQLAGLLTLVTWTVTWSVVILSLINVTIGLRISEEHEILGADLVEHDVGDLDYDKRTNTIIGMKISRMGNGKLTIRYANTANIEECQSYIEDFRTLSTRRHSSLRRHRLLETCPLQGHDDGMTKSQAGKAAKRKRIFPKTTKKRKLVRHFRRKPTNFEQSVISDHHSHHCDDIYDNNAINNVRELHRKDEELTENGHVKANFTEETVPGKKTYI